MPTPYGTVGARRRGTSADAPQAISRARDDAMPHTTKMPDRRARAGAAAGRLISITPDDIALIPPHCFCRAISLRYRKTPAYATFSSRYRRES